MLCDQFLRGAREAGHHAEKIYLTDKKIGYCTGCGACFSEGRDCVQQDDMTEILSKMIAADVMVMATPVYFYTMNGQMKTLIDRTCPAYTRISNKEMYFIMTAAVDEKELLQRTLEEYRGFTSCLNGAKESGVIYGINAWKKGDIKGSPAMAQAYEMGRNV